MSQNKPALRFDHREIAVVFSLFVFVSLLMFTVGILVGKGLAQAKFDAQNKHNSAAAMPIHDDGEHEATTDGHEGATELHGDHDAHKPSARREEKPAAEHTVEHTEEPEKKTTIVAKVGPEKEEELELIPLGPQKTDWNGTSLKNIKPSPEAEKLLENPKIKAIAERDTASTPEPKPITADPKSALSFDKGPFTVQVGSYPNLKDAEERVNLLKSLGFAHAYFSAKDLGDSTGTWYRVWLGYFPNYETAKKSGDKLQARGEVRNYLVRKSDAETKVN